MWCCLYRYWIYNIHWHFRCSHYTKELNMLSNHWIMNKLTVLCKQKHKKHRSITKSLPFWMWCCLCLYWIYDIVCLHCDNHKFSQTFIYFLFSDVWNIYLPYLYSFISFLGVIVLLCEYIYQWIVHFPFDLYTW